LLLYSSSRRSDAVVGLATKDVSASVALQSVVPRLQSLPVSVRATTVGRASSPRRRTVLARRQPATGVSVLPVSRETTAMSSSTSVHRSRVSMVRNAFNC